jgi:hypothetical protein
MIAIYITTENMTAAQHAEGRKRLKAAGAPEDAMKVHSVFGEEGTLQVFDIWETREAFDSFLGYLVPILEELGVKLSAPPTIMPVVELVQ